MPGRPRTGSPRTGRPRKEVGADRVGADGPGGHDGEPAEPADPESVARLICLRQLTAAPRTRAQLADTLRRRGVPDEAATAVLARFAEVGLIDDAMFASAWVESRHSGRGLGRRALAAELNQRGVDRCDIQAAVAQLSPETELATAQALVQRRLASTAGQPAAVRIRRLAGMLARKGYPAGLAYRVVREALEQEGQDRAPGIDEEAFEAEFADGEAS
jgi:regulatory protein